jgi:D-amino-acid oxidase
MKRREFLEAGALTAPASLAAGCANRKTVAAAAPPPHPASTRVALAVPRISWERVIRTTVGLRPHRDSGFVLKPEKFDEKTVIHNYGFGGTGMSLAWGCGAMAAGIALEHGERRAAVLGCGSPGLTATVPPDTTSSMSMAGFTPTAGLVSVTRTAAASQSTARPAT